MACTTWAAFRRRRGGGLAVGTLAADSLKSTPQKDVIGGLGGKDKIRADRGSDIVCAGSCNDKVVGGTGKDRRQSTRQVRSCGNLVKVVEITLKMGLGKSESGERVPLVKV
jgi:hypothetical protein